MGVLNNVCDLSCAIPSLSWLSIYAIKINSLTSVLVTSSYVQVFYISTIVNPLLSTPICCSCVDWLFTEL